MVAKIESTGQAEINAQLFVKTCGTLASTAALWSGIRRRIRRRNGAQTFAQVDRNVTDVGADSNPCTGEPGTLAQTYHDIFHGTINKTGSWSTGTLTGSLQLVPDNPASPPTPATSPPGSATRTTSTTTSSTKAALLEVLEAMQAAVVDDRVRTNPRYVIRGRRGLRFHRVAASAELICDCPQDPCSRSASSSLLLISPLCRAGSACAARMAGRALMSRAQPVDGVGSGRRD